MVSNSDKDRHKFQDYMSGGNAKSNMSHLSNTESAAKRKHKLTDLQVLQQIDTTQDPEGKYALRKIDFTNKSVCVGGRKEFGSKIDALKALE